MIHDFAIIGGGIAGLSAAAHLARLGSVVVLEAEDALGYHASGRSAAIFIETYGNPTVQALNAASIKGHRAAGVMTPRGMMMLGQRDEVAQFRAGFAELGMSEIPVTEAQARVPIIDLGAVTHAAWLEEATDLDTHGLLEHYRKQALGAGAEIVTKARVTDIAHGDSWTITAGDRVVQAKRVVNAAGAWADHIARMAGIAPLGLQPFRRSMARLPVPDGLDATHWPMIEGAKGDWYAKPDAGALIVSPADEDPQEPQDAWADDMVLAEGLARYEAYVTEPVTRMLGNWAGLRTFAQDRALVVGAEPDAPSFLWCAGQGGYGFQTAPAVAQLLADLVGGHRSELAPEVIAALSPGRFR